MEKNRVAFCTLGCKVNQYETNGMMQEFRKNDYEIVGFNEKADIYVVNTCTVTNMADKKSRQMLHKVKEINPNSILVAVRMLCTSRTRCPRANNRYRFDFRN